MKALLCTENPGLLVAQLEMHIEHLRKLKLEVVVVLCGSHSEHLLRGTRTLESCEVVFDTHSEQGLNFLTNLEAGVHCTEDACLVVSASEPLLDEPPARELIKRYYQEGFLTPFHLIWSGGERGPCLVTRTGNQFFRQAEGLSSLKDSSIQSLRIESAGPGSTVASPSTTL